ncbi:uncharacterized protein LOC111408988 [Olea europaea var. sylvestris]|uniref:uncharacterized protein LOC111408988 n=1 Tax=Olea europaea var. sylvestris TaxID=158386 RepID=UPI000C1D234C|nr:uncharacterized protein LOC111408988 [Olea europaea var. sylvestris]
MVAGCCLCRRMQAIAPISFGQCCLSLKSIKVQSPQERNEAFLYFLFHHFRMMWLWLFLKRSLDNNGILLNETNYDMWSQIMEMHIAEKEKLSFIRGNSQVPTEKDDGYEKSYAEHP